MEEGTFLDDYLNVKDQLMKEDPFLGSFNGGMNFNADFDGYGDHDVREEEFDYGEVDNFQYDEKPAAMPNTYYEEVEKFLNKPIPNMEKPTGSSTLKKSVPQQNAKKMGSKLRSKIEGSIDAAKRPLDSDLLKEAIAYSNRLLEDDDEVNIADMNEAPSVPYPNKSNRKDSDKLDTREDKFMLQKTKAAPPKSNGLTVFKKSHPYLSSMSNTKKKGHSKAINELKENYPNKAHRQPNESGTNQPVFDTRSANIHSYSNTGLPLSRENTSAGSGAPTMGLDVGGLVDNFMRGTTLTKLREELAESKRSMDRSNSFIYQLAEDLKGMK